MRPGEAIALVLILAAAVAGFIVMLRLPGNVAPAHPWRYPCRMHRAHGFEWFTPARLFWAGRCQQ